MVPAAPAASVVVPTRDRRASLDRLLGALAGQVEAPPFEVVVSDDGSTDGTPASLEARAGSLPFPVRVVAADRPAGPAAARNRGWRAAGAQHVLFTDDDCVPAPGWVAALSAALAGCDFASGPTRPPAGQLPEVGPFSAVIDTSDGRGFLTCNIAYRRHVLEAVGGFDSARYRYANGEDTDLGLRALARGFRHCYVPAALVEHDVKPSDFVAHLRRVPRLDGMVALVARHPEARAIIGAGWFLRSADRAVVLAWAAGLAHLVAPSRARTGLAVAAAAAFYARAANRAYYPARSLAERAGVLPLQFVADTYAVATMARSSLRWRTLLL